MNREELMRLGLASYNEGLKDGMETAIDLMYKIVEGGRPEITRVMGEIRKNSAPPNLEEILQGKLKDME